MSTPKVMKRLDDNTGLMECKVCGSRHYANIKPGGRGEYERGSWQCQHGCRLPNKEENRAWNGYEKKYIDL